jgi:hypothetical protein
VVETTYATGVRLKPKEMKALESEVNRLAVLGKWFVEIPGQTHLIYGISAQNPLEIPLVP